VFTTTIRLRVDDGHSTAYQRSSRSQPQSHWPTYLFRPQCSSPVVM